MTIRRLKKISDQHKTAILDELKALLCVHKEVIFALLYGSLIDPEAERYGDVDLAIYVKPEHLRMPEFIFESQIEAEATRLLSSRELNLIPVEVLIINNAPYSFLIRLFRGRYLALKEDEEALTDFIDEVGARSMANSHLRAESLHEVVED